MSGFLAVAFIYIACWSIMFYSQVYRWTFVNWVFFACITVASFVVLVLVTVFAVLCWLNFGKGLAQYREYSLLLTNTPCVFTERAMRSRCRSRACQGELHAGGLQRRRKGGRTDGHGPRRYTPYP